MYVALCENITDTRGEITLYIMTESTSDGEILIFRSPLPPCANLVPLMMHLLYFSRGYVSFGASDQAVLAMRTDFPGLNGNLVTVAVISATPIYLEWPNLELRLRTIFK